jgi:hypothetical protein
MNKKILNEEHVTSLSGRNQFMRSHRFMCRKFMHKKSELKSAVRGIKIGK